MRQLGPSGQGAPAYSPTSQIGQRSPSGDSESQEHESASGPRPERPAGRQVRLRDDESRKEEKKDAYKKPSRAPNTASEARTLRTLQVNPIVSKSLVGGRHQLK